MKMRLLAMVIFINVGCVAQPSNSKNGQFKVDSVFNYYFKLIELEISKSPVTDDNIRYFSELINEGDTIYMLKDLPKAYNFLVDVTGIKRPYSDKTEDMTLTEEIAERWKNWYLKNKADISWSKKLNKPILQRKSPR